MCPSEQACILLLELCTLVASAMTDRNPLIGRTKRSEKMMGRLSEIDPLLLLFMSDISLSSHYFSLFWLHIVE